MNAPKNNNARSLQDKVSKEYFAERFKEAFQIWKNENAGDGQAEFAEKCGIDGGKNVISKYATGQNIPSDGHFEKMLKEFEKIGLTKEFFMPDSDESRYRNSPELVKELVYQRKEKLNEIGLDLAFLEFIAKNTSFNKSYEPWSPIIYHNDLFSTKSPSPYMRRPLMEFTTLTKSDEKIFQVTTKKGKTFTLTDIDLLIIKRFQDELISYANYLYYKHSQEMQTQLDTLNKRSVKQVSKDGFAVHTLSEDEIEEIDPYMNYYKEHFTVISPDTKKGGKNGINKRKSK